MFNDHMIHLTTNLLSNGNGGLSCGCMFVPNRLDNQRFTAWIKYTGPPSKSSFGQMLFLCKGAANNISRKEKNAAFISLKVCSILQQLFKP